MKRLQILGIHGFIGRYRRNVVHPSTGREVGGMDRQTERIAAQPAGAHIRLMQHRVSAINTMRELGWARDVDVSRPLSLIVEVRSGHVAPARALVG